MSEIEGLPYSVQYQPDRRVEVFTDEYPRTFVHQGGAWTESALPVNPELAQVLEGYAPYDPAQAPPPAPPEPAPAPVPPL